MYKYGCQAILWGDEKDTDLPKVFREIGEAGFDAVEIGARYLDTEKKGYYLDLLAEAGLSLAAVHIGGNFLDAGSVNAQLKAVPHTAALAAGLGASHIFISGVYVENKTAAQYGAEARVLRELGKAVRDQGVGFCYHNHDWEIRDGLAGLRILLEEVDASVMQLVPDVGWITMGGEDPVAFVRRYYERIGAVHFKEFTENGAFAELGGGIVDFRGVYAALRDKEDLWLIAEQDTTTRTPLKSAKINMAYLRSLEGER